MRPDPIQRLDTTFFWDACERGEFLAQKCEPCNKLWHPPRPMCPDCHSLEKSTQNLSGKATILSWVRQVRPASFGFKESPIVILVELEEGLRMVSNLVGDEPPEIGDPVEVDFAKTSGGKAVPVFKKVAS
ncbi:MAG: hypothetical protein HKO02_16375 [Hyphomonadaceae bacterium]|nr:hypothetical protein [Hyphomonadaceae bacterium]